MMHKFVLWKIIDYVMQVYEDLKSKREKWERAIQAKLIAKIAKEKTTKVTQVRTNLETSDALPKDVKKVASQASSNVAKAD